jgi:uncharacterized phage protein (TIGR01671 family)
MSKQNREIKFRAFADLGKFKIMLEDVSIHPVSSMVGIHLEALVEILDQTDWKLTDDYEFENKVTLEKFPHDDVKVYDSGEDYFFFEDTTVLQYTGKKCFNDKEVYEGDILFYEDESEDEDKRYYLVVTWITEWCMFATLHLDEYRKYLSGGAKELDEVLFWTYPVTESDGYHYAGNIHQNPELLDK